MNLCEQVDPELRAYLRSIAPALQAAGQWVSPLPHWQLEQWEQQGSVALLVAFNQRVVQCFSTNSGGTFGEGADADAHWSSMALAHRHPRRVTNRVLTLAEIQVMLAIGCVEINPGPGEGSGDPDDIAGPSKSPLKEKSGSKRSREEFSEAAGQAAMRAAVVSKDTSGDESNNDAFKKPTGNSGKFYAKVPARAFYPGADENAWVSVVTHTGQRTKTWTQQHGGDGIFRLFPLLEGDDDESAYISSMAAPQRSGKRSIATLPRLSEGAAIPVKLDFFKHPVPGLEKHYIAIEILRGVKPEAKDNVGKNLKNNTLPVPRKSEDAMLVSKHAKLLKCIEAAWEPSKAAFESMKQARNKDAEAIKRAEMEARAIPLPNSQQYKDEVAAEKADEARERAPNQGAAWGFKRVVHEAARRLLVMAIKDSSTNADSLDAQMAMESLCHADADGSRMHTILQGIEEFNNASSLGIVPKHLMGEALELLVAHVYKLRETVELRDYLAEDRQRVYEALGKPGEDQSRSSSPGRLFVTCKVQKCWISGAPSGTPFHMTENDRTDLRNALEKQAATLMEEESVAEDLAIALCDHMRRDKGFDVLVWVQSSDGKNHFIAAQCKARSDFEAHVDAKPYVAHATELQIKAQPLQCLLPLLWCSNVTFQRSFTEKGNLASCAASGRAIQWILPNICSEEKDLLRRVLASAEFKPISELEPRPITLKAHQQKAAEDLAIARQQKKVRGTVNHATGSGKTFTLCEDMIRAEEDDTEVASLPSLISAPRIDLVLQVANECRSYEKSRSGVNARRFYYVVCSAGDGASSASLRVISVHDLVATLERHAADNTLNQCRFFTTVEGGGAFWYESRRYNLRRAKDPEMAVWGVFSRDEVHTMCGLNTSTYSLGLNTPALWAPSFTATPSVEQRRSKALQRTLKEGSEKAKKRLEARCKDKTPGSGAKDMSEDVLEEEDDEDEFVEGVNDDYDASFDEGNFGEGLDEDLFSRAPPKKKPKVSKRKASMLVDPMDLFPQVHGDGLARLAKEDPGLAGAVEINGLHGLQLLSSSLHFQPLEQIEDGPESKAAKELLDIISKLDPNASGFYAKLEEALGKPLAVFGVVPGAAPPGETSRYYDAEYDYRRRDFFQRWAPALGLATADNCVVLGAMHEDTWRFFRRVGPARGAAIHDCSDWSGLTNLVGPILSSYSFHSSFADGSLAKGRLAFSTRGILRLPQANTPPQRVLQDWAGIKTENKDSAKDEGGVIIQDPRRYFFRATFSNAKQVTATAHDFRCMAQLLDLFDDQGGAGAPAVTKAIVFCPNNEVARRCLRVFKAMTTQRAGLERDEAKRAQFATINADHIFQSDSSAPGAGQPFERRQQLIWRFRRATRGVLFNNSNVIIQRFGRCLRRTADPEKVGTLALPCTDPYEPDEDQLLEWKRIGLEAEVKQDRAAKFAAGFDLTCKVAECMLDPSISALGRLFSVVTGQQKGGKSRGSESGMEAGRLLRMMVSINNEPPRTLLLEDADVALFYDLASAAGRKLVVLTDADWLAVAARWKASQSDVPMEHSQRCRNGWPPTNGERSRYRDSEFGTLNFGGWLNYQRCTANGTNNSTPAEQKVAEMMLESLGKVLGLSSGWWKPEERIRTAVQMPKDAEECLKILQRWHAKEQLKEKPRDRPTQSGTAADFDDEESDTVWALGKWLNNKMNDAKGRAKAPAVQIAAVTLLNRVADVLGIPAKQGNDLYWWDRPRSAKPMPRDWESQRKIIELWRSNESATPKQSDTIDDPVDGTTRQIGSWLSTQMQEARNAYNKERASFTDTAVYKKLVKIGEAFGLPHKRDDGSFWWESVITKITTKEHCSKVAEWWQQNPGSTSFFQRGQAGGVKYGSALTALLKLKPEDQNNADDEIAAQLTSAGWNGDPWPRISNFTPIKASSSKPAQKKNDEDEWCRKAVLFWCERNKKGAKEPVLKFKKHATVKVDGKDVDCGLGLRGLKRLSPEDQERNDKKIKDLLSRKPEWQGPEWPGIALLEEIPTSVREDLFKKYEQLAAFWWHKRGAAAGGNTFGQRDTIRQIDRGKDENIGSALKALQGNPSRAQSDEAIKQHLVELKHKGRAWPGLDNLTMI